MTDSELREMILRMQPDELYETARRLKMHGDMESLGVAFAMLHVTAGVGHIEALAELGLMQIMENSPMPDCKQGLRHLELAYLSGYIGALRITLDAIEAGVIDFAVLRSGAEDGDGFCTFMVALCTMGGVVVRQDDAEARRLMSLALERECPAAALGSALISLEREPDDLIYPKRMLDDAIYWAADRYGSGSTSALGGLRQEVMDRQHKRSGCLLAKVIGSPEEEGVDPMAYVRSFLEGHLFMKCLDQFAKNDPEDDSSNNDYRGDPLEQCAESFGCGYNPHLYQENAHGPVRDGMLAAIDIVGQRKKVLCLSMMDYDPTRSSFDTISSRMTKFGEYTVVIKDPKELIRRVEEAVEKLREEHGVDYKLSYGPVRYNLSLEGSAQYGEFNKGARYCWQNEFRFSIDLACGRVSDELMRHVTDFARLTIPVQPERDDDGLSLADTMMLEVGDLSGICDVFKTEEMLKGPSAGGIADDATKPIVERHESIEPRPTYCRAVARKESGAGVSIKLSEDAFFWAVV